MAEKSEQTDAPSPYKDLTLPVMFPKLHTEDEGGATTFSSSTCNPNLWNMLHAAETRWSEQSQPSNGNGAEVSVGAGETVIEALNMQRVRINQLPRLVSYPTFTVGVWVLTSVGYYMC